uniref:GT61_1 n=1 Tax=Plantago ovata TaxID=185002 RepID=S5RPW1_PLAOV|nr:GT61_1 [Plantago ovata]
MASVHKKKLKIYSGIFGGGLSRSQGKRLLRLCGVILCFILLFSIWSDIFKTLLPTLSRSHFGFKMGNIAPARLLDNETSNVSELSENDNVNDTKMSFQPEDNSATFHEEEQLCRKVGPHYGDNCDFEGDIRVQANSATIYVFKPKQNISKSWNIKPYVRWYAPNVRNWTVKLIGGNDKHKNLIPKCTHNHNDPAILYSMSGYIVNYYHSFSDFLFPLYTVCFGFHRDVHFLASDFVWWLNGKFHEVIESLTRHQVIDIDNENGQVHCYPKIVAGLKNPNLVIEQSEQKYETGASMLNFKKLIRRAYSLPRQKAMESIQGQKPPIPHLLIISRKRTRVLTNEGKISEAANELGFEVVTADPDTLTVSAFAQLVNSCDLMMGIHGAALTNMIFLPDNAVLLQILPFGEIDNFGRLYFGNPTVGMNIRYLEYKITTEESSLSQQYSTDDPVLSDPMSIHKKGWETIYSVYLENQNVTVNLGRFKDTLVQAKNLLS